MRAHSARLPFGNKDDPISTEPTADSISNAAGNRPVMSASLSVLTSDHADRQIFIGQQSPVARETTDDVLARLIRFEDATVFVVLAGRGQFARRLAGRPDFDVLQQWGNDSSMSWPSSPRDFRSRGTICAALSPNRP